MDSLLKRMPTSMLKLKLNDDHVMTVPLSVAFCMGTVKGVIEDCISEDDIMTQCPNDDNDSNDIDMTTTQKPQESPMLDLMPIPVPNVEPSIMEKIVEFYEQWLKDKTDNDAYDKKMEGIERKRLHDCEECYATLCTKKEKEEEEIVPPWLIAYVNMPHDILFPLLNAANFLNCPELMKVLATEVATQISKCKSPEEIRQRFNIVNDFTPEEQAEIDEEIEWCKNVME